MNFRIFQRLTSEPLLSGAFQQIFCWHVYLWQSWFCGTHASFDICVMAVALPSPHLYPVLSFWAHKDLTSFPCGEWRKWLYDWLRPRCGDTIFSTLEPLIAHIRPGQHSVFQSMPFSHQWLIFQPGSWRENSREQSKNKRKKIMLGCKKILEIICYWSTADLILIYAFICFHCWNALEVFYLSLSFLPSFLIFRNH